MWGRIGVTPYRHRIEQGLTIEDIKEMLVLSLIYPPNMTMHAQTGTEMFDFTICLDSQSFSISRKDPKEKRSKEPSEN